MRVVVGFGCDLIPFALGRKRIRLSPLEHSELPIHMRTPQSNFNPADILNCMRLVHWQTPWGRGKMRSGTPVNTSDGCHSTSHEHTTQTRYSLPAMNSPALPGEILDIIISLIIARAPPTESFDSPPPSPRPEESDAKHDVLGCALVCKAWLPVARRRLLSVYFPGGQVKIFPDPSQLFRLIEILSSPLCTFQQGFLKALCVTPVPCLGDYSYDDASFFLELSTLDNTVLPSLHTLIFENISPATRVDVDDYLNRSEENCESDRDSSEDGGKDSDEGDGDRGRSSRAPSTTSLFSQITHLELYSPLGSWFEDMVFTIRLCTSLEKITARGSRYGAVPHEIYPSLHPPKTLRKLDLDMESLVEMAEWFMSCKPPHAQISSVTICDFSWENHFDNGDVRWFFNGVGGNLEELEIHAHGYGLRSSSKTSSFVIPKKDTTVNPFLKNSSLKRLNITADLDVICDVLPCLFRNSEFAPSLETLELAIYEGSLEEYLPLVSKLVPLEGYLCSRPSLCLVTITPGDTTISRKDWKDLKTRMRKILPHSEERDMIKFEDTVAEGDNS